MAGETRANSNFEPEADNSLLAGNDLSKIALSPEEEAELEALLFGEPMGKSNAEPRQTLRQIRSQINQQRQDATKPLSNQLNPNGQAARPSQPPLPKTTPTPPLQNSSTAQPINRPTSNQNPIKTGPLPQQPIAKEPPTGKTGPLPSQVSKVRPPQPSVSNFGTLPPRTNDTRPVQPNINNARPAQPASQTANFNVPNPVVNKPRTGQQNFSFVPDAFDDFDSSESSIKSTKNTKNTENTKMPPRVTATISAKPTAKPVEKPQVAAFGDEPTTARFRPSAISTQAPKKKGEKWSRWDVIWAVIEAAVIVLIVIIIGYFLLENFAPQFLQPNLSSGGTVANNNLSMLSSNGAVINVDAGHTILNIPTPAATTTQAATTQATAADVTATPTTLAPTEAPTFAPYTIGASAAAFVGGAPTPTPVLAPTATPVPANPVASQPAGNKASPTPAVDYSQSPPLRLVIPKINLDSPVKDVTVKLGSWQVADYAAGHNLGTANPGEIGNMVIAGHRDIRGSVFLRLPELEKGDTFTVYSNAGVFHYIVTETYIVDPTDISVMNPTTDATATLITCTPLGTSNRRFIVRAKLVN